MISRLLLFLGFFTIVTPAAHGQQLWTLLLTHADPRSPAGSEMVFYGDVQYLAGGRLFGSSSLYTGLNSQGQNGPAVSYNSAETDPDFAEPILSQGRGGGQSLYEARSGRVRTDPVPEPATAILLGSGLVGLGLILRRRRH